MKLLAFAGSSSTTSINKKLVTYAAGLFNADEIEILDLNDFELPLFNLSDQLNYESEIEISPASKNKFCPLRIEIAEGKFS